MGTCFSYMRRCCNRICKRKYVRTRYSVDRDFSIEFENLMDDEFAQDEMQKPLTDREKELISAKKYDLLVHEQYHIDAEIKSKLAQQEEELRAEEEAFYEAKREAARITKLQRAKDQANKDKRSNNDSSWRDNADEWNVAGGEDDFEMFLASMKAKSVRARQRLGSADGQSSSSSTTQSHTKERSHTEASSVELEWDHEAGVVPNHHERSATEENLVALANRGYTQSPANSGDLEWDSDFVSAETTETEKLIPSEKTESKTDDAKAIDR